MNKKIVKDITEDNFSDYKKNEEVIKIYLTLLRKIIMMIWIIPIEMEKWFKKEEVNRIFDFTEENNNDELNDSDESRRTLKD